MDLSNLKPAEGSRHSNNFRRGRGHGSGNGKTAGKGHKGQKARSGATRPGFEGGQMPLYRRIPKRGFTNRNSKEIVAINVDALERFENGSEVTIQDLLDSKVIKNVYDGVKILGNGELTKKLTVKVNAFSEGAKAKIDYTITNESLYVIGYLFEFFEYNQLYEIFSDLEDFLDKEYHVKELDLYKVGDGILEIREGIEKKFPGAKFTNDADAMIKGFQSIQRILDGTISKYVEWLIKEV